jgi:ATP-binding protein involved in chromosome partitioning
VGKSTVAVNLALTLAAMGERVGLLDCDINAPDVPHMLGMRGVEPVTRRMRPELARSRRPAPRERYGVEVMSAGLEVPEGLPPRVSSRLLVSSLLRGLVFDVAWSARVLILDSPPGTGEEIQIMASELPISAVVFVTTPQDLAQMDAERSLTLLREYAVPVLGMVKNMASMTCPHCGEPIDMYASSPRLAEAGLDALGSIPFDVVLSASSDQGVPLVLSDPRGPIAYEFARIGAQVRRKLLGGVTA